MIYKIDAVVQPFKLEAVKKALIEAGVEGMTVSEVRGHGRQRGHKETYRGREYVVDFLPKVRFEIVLTEDRKEPVLRALMDAARTGAIGDGKIFVEPVVDVIRIRNEDRGPNAL